MEESVIFKKYLAHAVMEDDELTPIRQIENFFKSLSEEELIALVDKIISTNDHEQFQLFIYYIILFRDNSNIQLFINSPSLNVELLERIVLFTYGYCTLKDYPTELIFDEVLYFIDQQRLLGLLMDGKFINRDKLLLLYVLSKLDSASIKLYFEQKQTILDFISFFIKLPDDMVRSVIMKNYSLFQYIIIMSVEHIRDESVHSFFVKYQQDMDQISRLNDMLRNYQKKTDLESERKLPFEQRDMNRISFLVNRIRELPDSMKAIEHFDAEGAFADSVEKQMIKTIVQDPFFISMFKNRQSIFDSFE
ncbi:MAG: hypothetical protein PF637_11190 [Spirochaetes bacterium]|jgi:hypothetical protein|nr:hypothetical protein [Spirochaetota bacterium]